MPTAVMNAALGPTLAMLLALILWLFVRANADCLACVLRGQAVTFEPEAPAECVVAWGHSAHGRGCSGGGDPIRWTVDVSGADLRSFFLINK